MAGGNTVWQHEKKKRDDRLIMKKIRFLIVLLAICCIAMTGCGKTEQTRGTDLEVRKESAPPAKEGESPLPASSATGKPETGQENTRVCFVGNSLIDCGNQANFFMDFAEGFGRKISVDKLTWGGARLSDYAAGGFVGKKEIKKRLKGVDIVVFQDYGGWQGMETLKALRKLVAWCKKDAAFYYYMYDGDDEEMRASDYQKLKELNIGLIPKGQMIDALLGMSYTYEELHLENDFHPNNLNGYMAVLVMNGTIFQEKSTKLPKEWFFGEKEGRLAAAYAQVLDGIHGDSDEEKWEEFQKICKKADMLVQDPIN